MNGSQYYHKKWTNDVEEFNYGNYNYDDNYNPFDDDENYVHIIKCGRYETLTEIIFQKKKKITLKNERNFWAVFCHFDIVYCSIHLLTGVLRKSDSANWAVIKVLLNFRLNIFLDVAYSIRLDCALD